MASENNNENSNEEFRCVEVTTKKKNNERLENISLPMISDENRKRRKRFSYRPYASPTNRIIKKCGRYNVLTVKMPEKSSRYFRDLGNTLLNIRWRWILISLCIANAIAYLFFGSLWMVVVSIEENYVDEKNLPCVIGGTSFTNYFILAVETITTIGSGEIYPTECQSGWVLITFQAITGVAIEGALVTAVFVKMSRPQTKNSTKHFSKNAIICLRDGIPCLIFRIRDYMGKFWAKTSIKAVIIQKKVLADREPAPYYLQNLKLEQVGMLIWPQEIVHKITQDSPLWRVSQQILYKYRFELMIILEGDSLTTGQPSQSQTSYTNKEILWGYRFEPCVEYDDHQQKYVVDNRRFNSVKRHDMPDCSAQELQHLLVGSENGDAAE